MPGVLVFSVALCLPIPTFLFLKYSADPCFNFSPITDQRPLICAQTDGSSTKTKEKVKHTLALALWAFFSSSGSGGMGYGYFLLEAMEPVDDEGDFAGERVLEDRDRKETQNVLEHQKLQLTESFAKNLS